MICSYCKTTNPENKKSKFFRVDHCHTSGRVRGLLCANCNVGIGMFAEDAARISKAAEYCVANCQEIAA